MGEYITSALLLAIGHRILRLVCIIIVIVVVSKVTSILVDRFFRTRIATPKFYLEEKRARTLGALLKNILKYAVYLTGIIMILQEFRIDTTSILAGAGIVGLAIGVGAQNLVKDLIAGFFIIFEDQYSVGDYIAIDNMSGTVEDIGIRITKLRDANGVLHIIPNGSFTRVSNHTRGYMQAVINIPVSYEAELDKVIVLLNGCCEAIKTEYKEVVDGPKVLGVVDLSPGWIVIRVAAKTQPLEQQKIETAFRLKAREAFEKENIPGLPALLMRTDALEVKK